MKKLVETTRRINCEGGGALFGWLLLVSVALLGLAVALAQTVQTTSTAAAPILLSSSSNGIASVATDKSDYAPGDTVSITGTGWTPGQVVALHIDESDGDLPWDSSAFADAAGNFTNSTFVVQAHDIGVVFTLTATQGGITAQTQFTDVIAAGFAQNGDPGSFELTGNVVATALLGHTDWVGNGLGTTGLVNSITGAPLDATATYHIVDGYGGAADDSFANGEKADGNPNTYNWNSGGANNKDDMNNVFVHISQDKTGTALSNPNYGHRWITASADRLVSNGAAYVDFELSQAVISKISDVGCSMAPCGHFETTPTLAGTGGRTPGDLLVTAAYGSGGSVASMGMSQWGPPGCTGAICGWQDITGTIAPNSAFVATNTGIIPVPYLAFGSTTYHAPTSGGAIANQFVEMSIDLTQFIVTKVDPCDGIEVKTLFVRTKESPSTSAKMTDFIAPIPVGFTIGYKPTATGQDPHCSTDSGSLTVHISGGTAPYQCKLDGLGSYANCIDGDAFGGLAAGPHSVTVKETGGCEKATNSVMIAAAPSALVPLSSKVDPKCAADKGSMTVTFSGGVGPTYTCSLDGAAFASCGSGDTFSSLTPGISHTVTVKDSNGCTAPTSQSIAAAPSAIIALSTKVDPNCAADKGSMTVTFSGGTGPSYTCSLDGAAFASCASGDAFSNLTPGVSHNVVVKDSNGCTSAPTSQSIAAAPSAIVPLSSKVDPKCAADKGSMTVTFSGGTGPYTCSLDGAAFASCATGDAFSNLMPGISHIVMVKDSNGCTAPTSQSIAAAPNAIVPVSSKVDPKCATEKGSMIVTFSGGTGPSYTCSLDGAGFTSCASGDTFSNLTPGVSHNVVVKDSNGCTSATTSQSIVAAPSAIVPLSSKVDPKCAGDKGSMIVTFSGGTGPSYTCSLDGGPFNSCASGDSFTNLPPGVSHTVTVRDSNGCTAPTMQSIAAAPSALVPLSSKTDPKCAAEKGSMTVTFSGGTGPSYTCSLDGAGFTSCASGDTFSNLTPGISHAVTVKDSNGCTAPTSQSIAAAPSAILPLSSKTDPKCAGEKGSMTVTFSGGVGPSYTCSLDGAGFTSCASGDTFSNLTPGVSHNVVVKDSNGCTSAPTWQSITAAPSAILPLSSKTDPKCFGDKGSMTVTFSGGTGPSYTCSLDGAAFASCASGDAFSNLTPGVSHNVVVKDSNGCISAMTSQSIAAAPLEITTSSSKIDPTCDTPSSITVNFSGGTPGYQCSLDNGSFTTCISPKSYNGLATGLHTVKVKDSNGCGAGANQTQSQTLAAAPAKTNVTASITPSVITFGTSSITLSATVTDTTNNPPLVVDEGSVSFTMYDSNNNIVAPPPPLGPINVSAGTATIAFNPSALAAGTYHVTAHYVDGAGNPKFCPDTKDPSVTLQIINPFFTTVPSNLTNSSLMCFDTDPLPGRQFNLIYVQNGGATYTLNASNPGQFYDNVYYVDQDKMHVGTDVTLTLYVPYPFVTQGAQPVHVYDSVTVGDGQLFPCLNFTPGLDISGGYTVTVTGGHKSTNGAPIMLLGDQTVDGNGNPTAPAIGSFAVVTITGKLPPSGTIYANIHMDYGFKGVTDFKRTDLDTDNNATDATSATVGIVHGAETKPAGNPYTSGQPYHLKAYANGNLLCTKVNNQAVCEDVAYSVNIFKKSVGVAGNIANADTKAPVPGVPVKMFSDILRTKQVGDTAVTDSDGYYFINYKATGGTNTYYVEAMGQPKAGVITLKSNGFAVVSFQQLGDSSIVPASAAMMAANAPSEAAAPVSRSQPLNISTRGVVQSGDGAMIGGFIVTGSAPKTVVLRAIGPSLRAAGLAGALPDTVLELHDSKGRVLQINDNWRDGTDANQIRALGIAPVDDRESAMMATLSPGSYTAVVQGRSGGTGNALVEVYDLSPRSHSQLANISTRGSIKTADGVMIGGFILGGNTRVAVRALGPSLADAGVAGTLLSPALELRDRDGDLVAANAGWKKEQQSYFEELNLRPEYDSESAILVDLPAGPYTAVVSGRDGGTGVGLVEVYAIRPY